MVSRPMIQQKSFRTDKINPECVPDAYAYTGVPFGKERWSLKLFVREQSLNVVCLSIVAQKSKPAWIGGPFVF